MVQYIIFMYLEEQEFEPTITKHDLWPIIRHSPTQYVIQVTGDFVRTLFLLKLFQR